MSSTPCNSEALDRLVEPWAVKIAKSSGTTVEAIAANAETVRAALHELEPHGQKARQLLAARSGLSRPMMSKLETIGRHAQLIRHRRHFLPPSVSALYALARKPWPGFKRAVMMDLRGKSCAEIKALFAPTSPSKPTRKLMTILVPPDLDEAARCLLMADIEAALARIAETRRVDLEVSSPKIAQVIEASKASSTPSRAPPPQDQRQFEPPAEPSGEAADEKPMDLEEPAAGDIGSGQRLCFFTGENPPERNQAAIDTDSPYALESVLMDLPGRAVHQAPGLSFILLNRPQASDCQARPKV